MRILRNKELYEIFEGDARVNKKKVIFHIICKLIGFIRVFKGMDNEDILIDRILVALMHKKGKVAETSFVARSMISSVSEEDNDVNVLAHVFKSILKHEDFVEFNMSPLPRKKLLKDLYSGKIDLQGRTNSLVVRRQNFTGNNPTEKRVLNFFDQVSLLESEDQEFFMNKLESLTKDARNQVKSVSNSPSKFKPTKGHEEQESGTVSEENIIKVNLVKGISDEDDIAPFKNLAYKNDTKNQLSEKLDEEEDDDEINLLTEKRK